MKCKKLISGIVAIILVAVLAFGSTAAAAGAQVDSGAELALASQNVSELTAATDSSASSRADSLNDIDDAIGIIKIIIGAFSSSDKLTWDSFKTGVSRIFYMSVDKLIDSLVVGLSKVFPLMKRSDEADYKFKNSNVGSKAFNDKAAPTPAGTSAIRAPRSSQATSLTEITMSAEASPTPIPSIPPKSLMI